MNINFINNKKIIKNQSISKGILLIYINYYSKNLSEAKIGN